MVTAATSPYRHIRGPQVASIPLCWRCKGQHDWKFCSKLEDDLLDGRLRDDKRLATIAKYAGIEIASWSLNATTLEDVPSDVPLIAEARLAVMLAADLQAYAHWLENGDGGAASFSGWKSFEGSRKRWSHTTVISGLRCHIPESTLGFARRQVDMDRPPLAMRVGMLKFMLAAISSLGWERDFEHFVVIRRPMKDDPGLSLTRGIMRPGSTPLDCPICHDEIAASPNLAHCTFDTTRCCGHAFHQSCLTEWISRANGTTCPYCRAPLRITYHEYIYKTDWNRFLQHMDENIFRPSFSEGIDVSLYPAFRARDLLDSIHGPVTACTRRNKLDGSLRNGLSVRDYVSFRSWWRAYGPLYHGDVDH